MQVEPILLVLLPSLFELVSAASLGEKCANNYQCSNSMSYCKIESPSCNGGVCSCVPGFVEQENGECRRSVAIGAKCSTNDKCVAENSECINGKCQCSSGYKVGLKGNDCVSTLKSELYNGKCYDSVQCYYNMVCLLNQCTCYTGYKVVGNYECVIRSVGDSCAGDEDCSRTPNTYCSGVSSSDGRVKAPKGRCVCRNGYKEVKYLTSGNQLNMACIPTKDKLMEEGGQCHTAISSNSSTLLCARPFVCTNCDEAGARCTRQTLEYSATAPSVLYASASLFLPIILLAL